MKARLQKFIVQEGLTAAKLAEIVGVQPSAISHILSGRNYPRFDFLHNLLRAFPDMNARWLLLGEGDIHVQKVSLKETAEPQSEPPNSSPKQQENPPHKEASKSDEIPTAYTLSDDNLKHLNNKAKTIEKVIIFYTDNTFSMYENK